MELLLKERKDALKNLEEILSDPEKTKAFTSKSSERAYVTCGAILVLLKDLPRM